MSELVVTTYDEDDEDDVQEISLPSVSSAILSKVEEFLKHYAVEPLPEIEKPLKTGVLNELVQELFSKFVDVEREEVFELMLAANFMDIKPLLELTCSALALKIKGKNPEEIRKTFNITRE